MHSFDINSKEKFEKSIDYYQQAIQKDPNYALAYVRLASRYRSMETRGFLRREEAEPIARNALLKALELDDSLAEAHAVLGTFKMFDHQWAEAENEFMRALELDPNSVLVNNEYSHYLGTVGRPDEAVVYAIRAHELGAHELDRVAQPPGTLANAYLIARDFDKAIELFREFLKKRSNSAQTHVLLGEAYLGNGMLEEAVAEIETAVALDNDPQRWDRHPMLAYAYAVAGRRDEALKILHEQHRLAKRGYISPYNFAIIYTGLGDKDRAFEWLEKGYEQRAMLVVRLKSRPIFDPLRSDPRYAELLRRMNLSP